MESEEWWTDNALMVEIVEQCTGPHQRFNCPRHAARSQVQWLRVGPRSEMHRQPELDQALPHIKKAVEAGQGVILHWQQPFHRAPVAAAAAYRRVTVGRGLVFAFVMRSFVAATSQSNCFSSQC